MLLFGSWLAGQRQTPYISLLVQQLYGSWEWSQDCKCGGDVLPGAIAPALSSHPSPVFLLYVIYLGLGISFCLPSGDFYQTDVRFLSNIFVHALK